MAILLLAANAALAEGFEQPESMKRGFVIQFAQAFAAVRDVLWPILAALPQVPGDIVRTLMGLPVNEAKLPVLTGAALIIVVMFAIRSLARRLLPIHLPAAAAQVPARTLLRAVLRDMLDAAAMLFVAAILVEPMFDESRKIDALAVALIDTGLRFRLAMILCRVLLRREEPRLRLLDAGDAQVERAMPWLSSAAGLVAAFVTLVPVLINCGLPWVSAQAAGLATGALVTLLGVVAVKRFLAPALPPRPLLALFARVLVLAFGVAWGYGVVALDFPFYFAVVAICETFAAALLLDRLFEALHRDVGDTPHGESSRSFLHHLSRELKPCVRVVALATVLTVLLGLAADELPYLLGAERWGEIRHGAWMAVLAIAGAYFTYAISSAWIQARFGISDAPAIPGQDEDATPASRLSTIMPLVRGFLGVLILGTATLVALSELGVNIAPVLAGAGIFGLAISFGSQALIRDIVAGIFYMADDAFRIGEYIEAGRLKGTVERISLRSVRLRHHNGPIHTVPFGQLGSITNQSRDWVITKFNIRIARTNDYEFVRKTIKKIGQDLLLDEEHGREFLEPLKMQSVAGVDDHAYIVRLKFTTRPNKQWLVKREAMKRLIYTFAEKGIAFSSHEVTVHSAHDATPEEQGAVAASGRASKAEEAENADAR